MNNPKLALASMVFMLVMFSAGLALPLAADAKYTVASEEHLGEASVVVFDDFSNGKSEIRYYLVDEKTKKEKRLIFKKGKPPGFATGKKVKVRGRPSGKDFEVESLIILDSGPSASEPLDGAQAALAAPETRKVLTLLVDFTDAEVAAPGGNYGTDVQAVKNRMYNETKSVAGLLFNASLGTLTIDPDADNDGQQDVFHVSINDSYIGGDGNQCSPSTWVDLASSAWQAANPTKNINIYRHRLLIVPNYWDYGNRHCSWGGVAQVGCGTWCWALGADPDTIMHGVIIHELGHNLGFNHARTDENNNGYDPAENTDNAYGDSSDMMGGSRNWMKFNAPHAEDKGWTDPVNYEIRTIVPGDSPQTFDLFAMDDEVWDWPGLRALKMERNSNTDYYVTYRKASGDYNNVTSSYRNKINIHYGFDNSTYSYFVTALGPGQSFIDPAQDLVITATSEMAVSDQGLDTTVMGVEICSQNCSALAAPSGLVAAAQSTDTIDLSWNDNSSTEDGFDIERSLDGSSFSALVTVAADDTSYTDLGLATATTYYYRIRATEAGSTSAWSNTDSDTTLAIPPIADFTYLASFLDVDFTDTSSDSDGTISSWSWNFGDGNGSSGQNPSHSYAAAGTYQVLLTVTDDDGATDNSSQSVSVFEAPNEAPTAGFSVNTNALTADFSDSSTDADGSISTWSWDFGDGNTSAARNPSHTYDAGASYTVSLTVTDNDGATDSTSQGVTVTEPPNVDPTADFSFSTAGLGVDFSDLSSDTDGTVASWSWDFGDTNNSSAQNPSHTYGGTGTFNVTLTVTDNDGGSDTVSRSVSVTAPPASQDYPATSETAIAGTVNGTYSATAANDGNFQSITERESGGKKTSRHSYLEHRWNFDIPAGNSATVSINAWQTASDDNDTFNFYWSGNGNSWTYMMNTASISDGTPVAFELPAGTSGSVYIRAMDSDQTAGNITPDTLFVDSILITVSNSAPEPLSGDAPINLAATATSHNSVELTWTDRTSNEAGFVIERSLDGVNFSEVGTTGANLDSTALYNDGGLQELKTYTYRVHAFKGAERSGDSNEATAMTSAAPAISITTSAYKVKGGQKVDITWTGATTDPVIIYRDSVQIETPNDGKETDNIDAKGGGTYVYKVCETGDSPVCSAEDIVIF
jgi:PKD repeat protein